MNVLSLFDGMSCGQIALDQLDIKVDNYYASEINEDSIKVTLDNFPNTKEIGSIIDVKSELLPTIDLMFGGSSCQNFSIAGNRVGMATKEKNEIVTLEQYLDLKNQGFEFIGETYLFWEYVRLLKEIKPKYFMLENVKMSKKWEEVITKTLGVEPISINSKLLSAQKRPRMYWTNIPNITIPKDNGIFLKDILDDIPTEKPLAPYMTKEFDGVNRLDKGIFTFVDDDKACCLTKGAGHGNKILIDRKTMTRRHLTRTELEKLQTVPENYTKVVSTNKAGEMLGNGWTVDVIKHIFSFIPTEKNDNNNNNNDDDGFWN